MVGNNLLRAQGMCGSISGSIPADVSVRPMIRVRNITVGGKGVSIMDFNEFKTNVLSYAKEKVLRIVNYIFQVVIALA